MVKRVEIDVAQKRTEDRPLWPAFEPVNGLVIHARGIFLLRHLLEGGQKVPFREDLVIPPEPFLSFQIGRAHV